MNLLCALKHLVKKGVKRNLKCMVNEVVEKLIVQFYFSDIEEIDITDEKGTGIL